MTPREQYISRLKEKVFNNAMNEATTPSSEVKGVYRKTRLAANSALTQYNWSGVQEGVNMKLEVD